MKFRKSLGYIVRHGNVHVPGRIIPFQRESKVTGAGPVFGECISILESSEEMIGVGFGKVFDAKIVNCKSESGSPGLVLPETRSVTYWGVAVGRQMGFELVVRKDTGFFKAIHAFAYLKIHITFGVKVCTGEFIFVDNSVWHVLAMNSHVLKNRHVGTQEEVF